LRRQLAAAQESLARCRTQAATWQAAAQRLLAHFTSQLFADTASWPQPIPSTDEGADASTIELPQGFSQHPAGAAAVGAPLATESQAPSTGVGGN